MDGKVKNFEEHIIFLILRYLFLTYLDSGDRRLSTGWLKYSLKQRTFRVFAKCWRHLAKRRKHAVTRC